MAQYDPSALVQQPPQEPPKLIKVEMNVEETNTLLRQLVNEQLKTNKRLGILGYIITCIFGVTVTIAGLLL